MPRSGACAARRSESVTAKSRPKNAQNPALLAGGNPQIPKGEGDAPVQAWKGWFLNIHCFAKYIKVAFFRGTSLRPVPPGEWKHKEVRYLDIHEDDLDEPQFIDWVKQASKLPGERM